MIRLHVLSSYHSHGVRVLLSLFKQKWAQILCNKCTYFGTRVHVFIKLYFQVMLQDSCICQSTALGTHFGGIYQLNLQLFKKLKPVQPPG